VKKAVIMPAADVPLETYFSDEPLVNSTPRS
jgi:hypothetical protein